MTDDWIDGFPAGLPAQITGPTAWIGPDVQREGGWLQALSATDLGELEAAATPWLARTERDAGALNALTPPGFPLPTLGPRLAGLRTELLRGRGFAVLRGLPIERWGRRLSAVAFYGLGAHLGQPRPQNAQGHLLGHVRDVGLRVDDPQPLPPVYAQRYGNVAPGQRGGVALPGVVGVMPLPDP